ncbi:MAG: MBL fold metallo-hydrolase [Hyphomicrobiales bacterium]
MPVTLDWLGCATFRLVIDDLVVFLDAYMDRVPSAPPVGLSARDVDRADYVLVGHSHFDHIAGAEVIAQNTGATVIGSHESARVLRGVGVPEEQLWRSQGGEHWRLSPKVTVRVYPSLHSCVWASAFPKADEVALGQYGLTQDQRVRSRGLGDVIRDELGTGSDQAREMREHLATALGSSSDGGALAYVIETPYGAIFYQDTSGCWTGVLRDIRPDVAILAAAGRGNIDGEPIQGSLAQFVAREVDLLRPRRIVLGHHDNWMPPVTREGGTDTTPIREELARVYPRGELMEMGYLEGREIL